MAVAVDAVAEVIVGLHFFLKDQIDIEKQTRYGVLLRSLRLFSLH